MEKRQLYEYQFTSLNEVKAFIAICPDHIKPILWQLYLATLEYANEDQRNTRLN